MARPIGQPYKTEGAEAIVLLEVKWGNGMYTSYYADKAYGSYTASIVQFSGIKNQVAQNNTANTSACSMTLADINGLLKQGFHYMDYEGSWAVVKYYYTNVAGTPTTIIRGKVTNCVWDDKSHTMTFEIVSAIESKEIGFSIERETYPNLTANCDLAIGKVWPMVFGTVAHSPALLVQKCPESRIKKPISLGGNAVSKGIVKLAEDDPFSLDWMYEESLETILDMPIVDGEVDLKAIDKIEIDEPKKFPAPADGEYKVEIDGVIFRAITAVDDNNKRYIKVLESNIPKYENLTFQGRLNDHDKSNPRVAWLKSKWSNCDLTNHYTYSWVAIWENDPKTGQGSYVTYRYENMIMRQEGLKVWFKYPFPKGYINGTPAKILEQKAKGDAQPIEQYILIDASTVIHEAQAVADSGLITNDLHKFQEDLSDALLQRRADLNLKQDENARTTVWGPFLNQVKLLELIRNAFWHAPAGTTVRQWLPPVGDVYVANVFSSDEVIAVYGKRKDQKKMKDIFVPIPSSYYTIDKSRDTQIENGPQNCTTIEFKRPLSSYHGQEWDDEVYVSLTSNMTSNSAYLIQAILEDFTDLEIDGDSFDYVAMQVANYPCNFTLTSAKDALGLAKEIAWQSCCALIVDGPTVKIRYLATEPGYDTSFIFNERTCQFQTLSYSTTGIDDILTRLEGKWNRTYAPKPFDYERKVAYRHNGEKYGLRNTEHDIFIYNDEQLVKRTLEFWGNRFSHSWRLVSGKCFSSSLMLEPFDCVAVAFSQFDSLVTKAIVKSIDHDVHSNTSTFTLWLPIESGSSSQSGQAWIAGGSYTLDDPTEMLEESNVPVVIHSKELDLKEIEREMHKAEDAIMVLAKITKIMTDHANGYICDVYANGCFVPATKTDVAVWDVVPYKQLNVGDWIQVQGGQDGVKYCDRVDFGNQLGVVTEVSNDPAKYKVRLIYSSETPTATDPTFDEDDKTKVLNPDWALDYFQEEDDPVDQENIIDCYNIAELNSSRTGKVKVGSLVLVKHLSNMTTTNNDEGYWWFDRAVSPDGFWARLDGHADVGAAEDFRWKYSWTEMEYGADDTDAFAEVTDGLTGTTDKNYALNTLEIINPTTTSNEDGSYGNGILYEELHTDAGTWVLTPITVGNIVWVRSTVSEDKDKVVYWFSVPNGTSGECAV